MNAYAIYLRKSRADVEAESRGEGETLARHRTALRAFAERRGLNVVREYSELVTGDSIAARPQMQLLLDDVKKGLYAGVIVNDVDRLGRGDSIDQEIIKYTFVAGNCLIITPTRDINPASPTDEDMLDFSMFFARFELRKIKQRLNTGRTRSAASGNFISARVPFGYKKVVNGKSIKLIPDEEKAGIVRMIFDWYASERYGYKMIATKLNQIGIKTNLGNKFERATVKNMLTNPVYIGQIAWGRTSTISAIEDGRRQKKHVRATPTIVDGAHPPIVSRETFDKVQQMFVESRHASHAKPKVKLVNPLAGLLYCANCGKALSMRGGNRGRMQDRILTCTNTDCPTRGTYIHIIVDIVLSQLREWCATYQTPDVTPAPEPDNTETFRRQIETAESQIAKAQELVELGVYTPSEYIKRRDELLGRIEALRRQMEEQPKPSQTANIREVLPAIERVIDAYQYADTIENKNKLLKSIIARIEYSKTEVATKAKSPEGLVTLTIYPRIMRE